MPLSSAVADTGKDIKEMVRAGHPKRVAIAAALRATGQSNQSEDDTGLQKLSDVEIFAAGEHRDKPYTDADPAEIVQNFERFQSGDKPLLRSPAVIGHEETQEFLERTDLPAAAWASKLWTEQKPCPSCNGTGDDPFSDQKCESCKGTGQTTILMADFIDVPPPVARLIKQKSYRTVSAEIYDEPPEGINGTGKMLRRTAFLGGEIPQVKTLAELPMPEKMAEREAQLSRLMMRAVRRTKAGTYCCFSEVQRLPGIKKKQRAA